MFVKKLLAPIDLPNINFTAELKMCTCCGKFSLEIGRIRISRHMLPLRKRAAKRRPNNKIWILFLKLCPTCSALPGFRKVPALAQIKDSAASQPKWFRQRSKTTRIKELCEVNSIGFSKLFLPVSAFGAIGSPSGATAARDLAPKSLLDKRVKRTKFEDRRIVRVLLCFPLLPLSG